MIFKETVLSNLNATDKAPFWMASLMSSSNHETAGSSLIKTYQLKMMVKVGLKGPWISLYHKHVQHEFHWAMSCLWLTPAEKGYLFCKMWGWSWWCSPCSVCLKMRWTFMIPTSENQFSCSHTHKESKEWKYLIEWAMFVLNEGICSIKKVLYVCVFLVCFCGWLWSVSWMDQQVCNFTF